MRITVEIDEVRRAELLELAAARGEKDFSRIVQHALDLHLKTHRARRNAIAKALALQGTFTGADGDALEASTRGLRENWPGR